VRAAWWHEQQDEVIDGFLVEPQNQGQAGTTWEPSHEWRLAEATPSSRGSSGSPENHWVPWLIHIAKTEEPKTVLQQCQTGLTGGSDRSDGWVPVRPVRSTGLTCVRRRSPESSKRRTRVGIARLASRLSSLRSPGIRPMEKASRLPRPPLRGMYP
jgi:hypothetical protein